MSRLMRAKSPTKRASVSGDSVITMLEPWIARWQIAVERTVVSHQSVLAFGRCDERDVVLKVSRQRDSEPLFGAVLAAFNGHGMVRVLDHADGAVLLERLRPGTDLTSIEDDEEATAALCEVIRQLSAASPQCRVPSVEDWADSYESYCVNCDGPVPLSLVAAAKRVHTALSASQGQGRLLHGDLHHGNVLFDSTRGWVGIDPKGVVGEIEYEFGAALRNPCERPEVFTDSATIMRRVGRFAGEFCLDPQRILGWAFAQAVLAAIWAHEDGAPASLLTAWVTFASVVKPRLSC
jgi:streptomycin 6-kinase